jgi:hypothetical protein
MDENFGNFWSIFDRFFGKFYKNTAANFSPPNRLKVYPTAPLQPP